MGLETQNFNIPNGSWEQVRDRVRRLFQQLGSLSIPKLGISAGGVLAKDDTPDSPTYGELTLSFGDGLANDADTLVVDLAATPGLEFSGGDLTVKVKAAGGILIDGDGLYSDIDLSGYVPYVGATAEVDLGAQNLTTTGNLTGDYIDLIDDAVGVQFDSSPVLHAPGTGNIACGKNTFTAITTGTNNAAFGQDALKSVTSGTSNVGFGPQALTACTTGYNNMAIGKGALSQILTGYSNVAVGTYALGLLLGGTFCNVGIGHSALYNLKTGYHNVAIGYQAGYLTDSSIFNVAIGSKALYSAAAGHKNVAIGGHSLYTLNTGHSNVSIGMQAAEVATTAHHNTNIGFESFKALTTGDENTAIGANAGNSLTTGDGNVLIGYQAGGQLTIESDKLYIDNSDTAAPLILGDFNADELTINGDLKVTGATKLGSGTKYDGLNIADSAEVQTTDAVQTTLTSLTLEDENTYHVEVYIIGVQSDGTDRASYHLACTVYRTGAGNATLQGGVTSLHAQESNAALDATFTVNGNDLRVSVTGIAAETWEWGCTLKYMNCSN